MEALFFLGMSTRKDEVYALGSEELLNHSRIALYMSYEMISQQVVKKYPTVWSRSTFGG